MRQVHECERYKGKIGDVSFNQGGEIFCRACGKALPEEHVEPQMLSFIRRKLEQRR